MNIQAIPFTTVGEAFQHMDASGYGDEVLSVRGIDGYLLVRRDTADQLAKADAIASKWLWHEATMQIMSVPMD